MSEKPGPSEMPEYHPAVEKYVEPLGVDKGRITDEDLARTLADHVDAQRDLHVPEAKRDEGVHNAIRNVIASDAVRESRAPETIAHQALLHPDKPLPGWVAQDAATTARDAAASYDQLEQDTGPARQVRSEEQEKLRRRLGPDGKLKQDS